MRITLRDAFLVFAGVAATIIVQSGAPFLGVTLYGNDFKTAYTDCERAKAAAAKVRPGTLPKITAENFHNTVLVDEFRCFDSEAMYDRLRQFHVSEATIDGMKTEARVIAPELSR